MDAEKTGRLIRKLREEAGLSQKQLADKINVTNTAVSKYEHGTRFPDLSVIERLAAALNTDVASLISAEETAVQNDPHVQEEIRQLQSSEKQKRKTETFLIAGYFSVLILRVLPFFSYPGVAEVTGTVSFLKYPLLFMIAAGLFVSGVLRIRVSQYAGIILMTASVILTALADILCWPFAVLRIDMISVALILTYTIYLFMIFTAVKKLR